MHLAANDVNLGRLRGQKSWTSQLFADDPLFVRRHLSFSFCGVDNFQRNYTLKIGWNKKSMTTESLNLFCYFGRPIISPGRLDDFGHGDVTALCLLLVFFLESVARRCKTLRAACDFPYHNPPGPATTVCP